MGAENQPTPMRYYANFPNNKRLRSKIIRKQLYSCWTCLPTLHGYHKKSYVHESVLRDFRVVEDDDLVHRWTVKVLRWVCDSCRRTFRYLPPFLEHLKRYATFSIKKMVTRVLDEQAESYRDAANDGSIFHHWREDEPTSLSHATVHRWITWMSMVMLRCLKIEPKSASEEDLSEKNAYKFSGKWHRSAQRLQDLELAKRLRNHKSYIFENFPRKRNMIF